MHEREVLRHNPTNTESSSRITVTVTHFGTYSPLPPLLQRPFTTHDSASRRLYIQRIVDPSRSWLCNNTHIVHFQRFAAPSPPNMSFRDAEQDDIGNQLDDVRSCFSLRSQFCVNLTRTGLRMRRLLLHFSTLRCFSRSRVPLLVVRPLSSAVASRLARPLSNALGILTLILRGLATNKVTFQRLLVKLCARESGLPPKPRSTPYFGLFSDIKSML